MKKNKFRLGKKQERALLTENGDEVAIFNEKYKDVANQVCDLLNHNEQLQQEAELHIFEILIKEIEKRISNIKLDKLISDKDRSTILRENNRFLARCQQFYLDKINQLKSQLNETT